MTDLNNMYGFGARPNNQSNPVYQQQKTQKLPETDSQETVILPALQENRQQVPNYYNSYAPQQVPATYTAELPLNPKDGILYKNTGRNLQELKDPTPIILESPFGRMTLTLDSLSIYRQGDSAKSHKNYFVEVPLVSVSSAFVLTDTAKDGSIRVAVVLDVVQADGSHQEAPADYDSARKNVWSFEVGSEKEARVFCDKVNSRLQGERVPMREMPIIDNGGRNTLIAGIIAGVLAVALVVICFTGHPYSSGSYELSPAEIASIRKNAEEKAQKEAQDKADKEAAQQKQEQDKKAQEEADKQKQQQTQQDDAAKADAKQKASSLIATSGPMSRQSLINKLVSQGVNQDLAGQTADSLGINWASNATEQGRGYLQSNKDWTEDQLVNQLTKNDLYTQQEANTAKNNLAEVFAQNKATDTQQSTDNKDSGNPLNGLTNLFGGDKK